MGRTKWLIVALLAIQTAAAASAGEPKNPRISLAASGQAHSGRQAINDSRLTAAPIDRVASAVDGAESSHGKDMAMWRPDPSGPQGPMQVTELAQGQLPVHPHVRGADVATLALLEHAGGSPPRAWGRF